MSWQICRFWEYLPPPISTQTVHIVPNRSLYGILAMLTANGTLTSFHGTNVVTWVDDFATFILFFATVLAFLVLAESVVFFRSGEIPNMQQQQPTNTRLSPALSFNYQSWTVFITVHCALEQTTKLNEIGKSAVFDNICHHLLRRFYMNDLHTIHCFHNNRTTSL